MLFSKKIDTKKADPLAEMKSAISAAIDRALKNYVPASRIIACLEGYLPQNGSPSRLSALALHQETERSHRTPVLCDPVSYRPINLDAQVQKAEAFRERRRQQAEADERKAYREDVERRARAEDLRRP